MIKLGLTILFSLIAIGLLCYGIWREEELVEWEERQTDEIARYTEAFVLYIKKHGIKHFLKKVVLAAIENYEEKRSGRTSNVVALKKTR